MEKIAYGRAYSVVLYFIFEEKLLIEKESALFVDCFLSVDYYKTSSDIRGCL